MECSICYELIENSCIGSCMHHFCYKCILKWCSVGGYNCPVCKTKIRQIKFDKEFDSINNPKQNLPIISLTKDIKVEFTNILPQITLINNDGPGVKIKKLKTSGQCYISGLRENNIILFINNISYYNHSDCIEFIDYAYKNKNSLTFSILIY